jgi:hypothetical protein
MATKTSKSALIDDEILLQYYTASELANDYRLIMHLKT